MRSRLRDRQKIWFVTVSEKKDGIDTVKQYGKPVLKRMSVSSGTGQPGQVSAGIVADYDREITSYDKGIRGIFREGDACFVDTIPQLDENGNLEMMDDGYTPKTFPDYRILSIFSTQKGEVDVYGIKKEGGMENG